LKITPNGTGKRCLSCLAAALGLVLLAPSGPAAEIRKQTYVYKTVEFLTKHLRRTDTANEQKKVKIAGIVMGMPAPCFRRTTAESEL